jgi:hypothetical protein
VGLTALLLLRRSHGFLAPLKIHHTRAGLNPRTLGSVASTITTKRPTQRLTVFAFVNSSGIFCMLLQRLWQTAYNQIFRFRQIAVRIYFHAYNRIRVGGWFAVYRTIIIVLAVFIYSVTWLWNFVSRTKGLTGKNSSGAQDRDFPSKLVNILEATHACIHVNRPYSALTGPVSILIDVGPPRRSLELTAILR